MTTLPWRANSTTCATSSVVGLGLERDDVLTLGPVGVDRGDSRCRVAGRDDLLGDLAQAADADQHHDDVRVEQVPHRVDRVHRRHARVGQRRRGCRVEVTDQREVTLVGLDVVGHPAVDGNARRGRELGPRARHRARVVTAGAAVSTLAARPDGPHQDAVADRYLGDPGPDALHDAGRLVAEGGAEEGPRLVHTEQMHIGMTQPGRLHTDQGFALRRGGHLDLLDLCDAGGSKFERAHGELHLDAERLNPK